MFKRKFEVEVERVVNVEIDADKFDDEFMEDYRKSFDSSFYDIEDHIRHLGWLYAAGRIDGTPNEFIEGYGIAKEMGIKFEEPYNLYGDEVNETELLMENTDD